MTTEILLLLLLILENPLWEPKDVKIEFLKTAFNTVYTTSYYLLDFTKVGATSSLKEMVFWKLNYLNQLMKMH